ncbi:MAG: hypothetical protein H0V17_29785 [Deltaproteobacteria bacterium]|nr:hypothetical protein [Deltaproteobacteria bacterium]
MRNGATRVIEMREHPRLLSLVLVAFAGLVGVATIRIATEPADRLARIREPMPEGLCGHAVSEWLRERGEDD